MARPGPTVPQGNGGAGGPVSRLVRHPGVRTPVSPALPFPGGPALCPGLAGGPFLAQAPLRGNPPRSDPARPVGPQVHGARGHRPFVPGPAHSGPDRGGLPIRRPPGCALVRPPAATQPPGRCQRASRPAPPGSAGRTANHVAGHDFRQSLHGRHGRLAAPGRPRPPGQDPGGDSRRQPAFAGSIVPAGSDRLPATPGPGGACRRRRGPARLGAGGPWPHDRAMDDLARSRTPPGRSAGRGRNTGPVLCPHAVGHAAPGPVPGTDSGLHPGPGSGWLAGSPSGGGRLSHPSEGPGAPCRRGVAAHHRCPPPPDGH